MKETGFAGFVCQLTRRNSTRQPQRMLCPKRPGTGRTETPLKQVLIHSAFRVKIASPPIVRFWQLRYERE